MIIHTDKFRMMKATNATIVVTHGKTNVGLEFFRKIKSISGPGSNTESAASRPREVFITNLSANREMSGAPIVCQYIVKVNQATNTDAAKKWIYTSHDANVFSSGRGRIFNGRGFEGGCEAKGHQGDNSKNLFHGNYF